MLSPSLLVVFADPHIIKPYQFSILTHYLFTKILLLLLLLLVFWNLCLEMDVFCFRSDIKNAQDLLTTCATYEKLENSDNTFLSNHDYSYSRKYSAFDQPHNHSHGNDKSSNWPKPTERHRHPDLSTIN